MHSNRKIKEQLTHLTFPVDKGVGKVATADYSRNLHYAGHLQGKFMTIRKGDEWAYVTGIGRAA